MYGSSEIKELWKEYKGWWLPYPEDATGQDPYRLLCVYPEPFICWGKDGMDRDKMVESNY